MAIHAHFAVAKEIIKEDVLASEAVLVGCDCFAVNCEIRISVSERFARRIELILMQHAGAHFRQQHPMITVHRRQSFLRLQVDRHGYRRGRGS